MNYKDFSLKRLDGINKIYRIIDYKKNLVHLDTLVSKPLGREIFFIYFTVPSLDTYLRRGYQTGGLITRELF